MNLMLHTPLNAFTWILGCAAMVLFASKSLRTYRAGKNPLALIYIWITAMLGIAFLFFGIPPLLTENARVLKYTYFLADFFVQCSMQAMTWLLWFIGLQSHVRLKVLLTGTSLFSAILLSLQLLTSHAAIDKSPHLVVYSDQLPVLIMKSCIYIAVAWPIGYFLIRQVRAQVSLRAKIKSLSTGLIFILVSLAATTNNIFDKGSDTVQSTGMLAVFFGIFLLIAAWPRAKPRAY